MTDRIAARVVGGLFILATAAGVMSVVFLQPIVDAADYLTKASVDESQVTTGALFELMMYVAIVGIAIVMYPILRRFSERFAVGYVAARTIEVMTFVVSTISVLTLMTLGREFVIAGSPELSHYQTLGDVLLARSDWGGAVVAAAAFSLSALILNYALYRTHLVPRWLAGWGFGGAVLYLAVAVLVLYGLEPASTTTYLLDAPLAVQEMVFAVWLIAKGFNTASSASEPEKEPAAVTG